MARKSALIFLLAFITTLLGLCAFCPAAQADEPQDVIQAWQDDHPGNEWQLVIQRGNYGCDKGEHAVIGIAKGQLEHGCATPVGFDGWLIVWADGGRFLIPPSELRPWHPMTGSLENQKDLKL